MQRKIVRIFLSAFLSAASVLPAIADSSVEYTVTMPHYKMDGTQILGSPTFVVHGPDPTWATFTSGKYTAFESSPYTTTDNFKCQNPPEGYYASKWELFTKSGKTLFSTDQELATVQFLYSWYKKYSEKQLTLIVSIDQKQYTVSYDANGGAWNGSEPAAKTYKYNVPGTALPRTSVVRDGNEPTGWNTSRDGSGTSVAFGAAFTGKTFGITAKETDIVLYAQYKPKSYTATIAAGEGGTGSSTVGYSYSTSQQTKSVTLPTREGHGISGWTATGYGGTAPTIQGTTLTIPANTSGGFTMTPTWKANTYSLNVEKGAGIAQIAVDFTRDGKACHETTSYATTYSVDFGTAWSAYAVAAEGYATNATCAASGKMTTAGATFAPYATSRDFDLRLTPGTGIATIWYRVGLASEWSWTTNNAVVPVAYGATWQAYAEADEGYEYTATSRERPASGTMTTGGASFEPVGTVKSYVLRLEVTPGIAKICYRAGAQQYYDETTASRSVSVPYGTAWSAYALAVEGCATNETCAASGTIGVGGALFRPRVNAKPYSLTLAPGTGIAEIYYKTNETQKTWVRTDKAATVPVLYGDTWSAYAVAGTGYAYKATSEAFPKTGVMTTEGDVFAPAASANAIWVRYDRNGGGDAGRMDDSEFAYGVEAPLRRNAYARSYEVHYNGNGGSAHENDISGYAFAGWRDTAEGLTGEGHYSYSDGQGVKNPCGSTGAPANDPVILYAQWTPKAVTLPLPVRSGYDFSGWYTLREGGQRVGGAGETYAATDDVTLYAHWRTHVTRLRFVVGDVEAEDYAHAVANGQTYGDFGSLPELTSDDPKKLFLGWYTAPEGGTRITDATMVNLTGDTAVLYAQWETVTYTITYETNGGTINEYAKTGYKPSQAFALPTDVTRTDGRDFLGWYDNPTFEGEPVAGITSADRGDKTFYAKWSEASTDKVTLTFVNVSGYEYFSNKVTHAWGWKTLVDETTPALTRTYAKDASVTLPDALFTQDGYRQVGWRREGDSHVDPDKWDAAGVGDAIGAVAQDGTFHTIWEANTYTVKYDGNGAETTSTKYDAVVRYSKPYTIHAYDSHDFSKEGCTFAGWALDAKGHVVYVGNGKEIVSNLTAQAGGVVTLYAVWEEVTNAEVPVVKSVLKSTAARTPLSTLSPSQSLTLSPSHLLTLSPSHLLTPSTSQPTYTIHFSPGADVVNPQAMTNWLDCVSGESVKPDCLYTNLYSDGFIGWVYGGQTNTTVAPVASFDGQVITMSAAWKEYEPGLYSRAVGLKNVELTCRPGSEWTRQTTGGVDKEKPSCLLAASTQDRVLSMQVNGPGRITYYWRYDTAGGIASNVVDGVATAIVSSKSWEEKSLVLEGDGAHQISWFVPSEQPVYQPDFFIDKVRWEPTPRQYELTTAAEPSDGGTTSGGGSYASGATAEFVAVANPGFMFVQWNDGSTDPVHTTTVWGDITNYVATFKSKTYTVTGAAIPSEGGTVAGGGTYAVGTQVTLVAKPTDENWAFTQWADGVEAASRQITVSKDETYTALFTNQYAITGAAIPSEGGTVTGGGRYKVGTTATLKAVPANDDWTFVKWSDDYPSAERSFTVAKDAAYEALFTNQYLVTVTATPTEGGTVTGGGRYVVGTDAVLSATANEGYTFERWSDGSTDVTHTITVLCATNLTATFSGSGPTPPGPNYHYVDFDGNGATGGAMAEQQIVCGGETNLMLNAFVRTGYEFDHWLSVAGKTAGKTYADGATVSKDLANTNCAALLKAVWKPTECRVDFDGNGATSGTMESLKGCCYDVSYQLPDCTFARDKETFAGWATDAAGAVVYKDGAIVRNLSATGGVITLYAVWGGHGTKEVNITGHTATKHYTGRPFTVSGYDAEILSEGYYTKDFTAKPGTVTSITETDVKYDTWGNVAKYTMGLSSDSFTNLVPSVGVLFNVEDGWLKILPSRIGGEPQAAAGSQLSAFDGEGTYGKPFDGSAISNAYANAGYGVTKLEYAALESGPWSTNAPVMAVLGATSIWYRVSATGYEPYAHEVAVRVYARPVSEATVAAIPDQEWTGTAITPEPEVRAEDTVLVKGADYYLTYHDNTDPGTATVTVHGIGNWQGTTTADFKIVRIRDIDETAVAAIPDQMWTGQPVEPKVTVTVKGEGTTLAEGVDYNLTYANNVNPGVATVFVNGTNSWRGTISATFKIIRTISGEPGSGVVPPGGLSKFDVTAVYDGKPHTVDAAALRQAYADVYAGAAVAFAATSQGPWGATPISLVNVGTTSLWYRVTASYCKAFVHEAKVTVTPRDLALATLAAIPGQTWTGKPVEPPVTVTDGKPSIITAGDYDVAYSDNVDLGTATVTLTGKRNYAGTKTAHFAIVKGAIPGEPGAGKVPAGGLSKYDATYVYDGEEHALNAEALTNAFVGAGYAIEKIEYAATSAGSWREDPPAISDAGATSFWYRVSCENYEPFVHQAKVTVTPCDTVVVSVTGHVATNVYDGLAHRVEGYDVSIAGSALYTEDDFAFAGTDYAERTKPGVTRYGMTPSQFRNVNGNFANVTFVVVRDGESAVVWDEPPAGVGEVGRYYGYTLVELGCDATDATAVKAEGLPAGLALKKGSINGYWYVEGIPTATASTNGAQCAYLRITRTVGKAKVEEVVELPIEVREARVREIDPPAVLNENYGPTPVDELWPEVAEAVTTASKDWSFTGWPTGIRYTTRDVARQAEAYDVYGKATKAGVFTVTATRTVSSLFTTAKYKEKYYASFMTQPEKGAGIACTSTAYEAIEPVFWADVKSASGLPTGLKCGSVKGGVEVYGTPTKAGVFAVARTYADRTKDTVLWQVLPGENGGATVDFGESRVESGIVQVELGLPVTWPLAAAEGAKVTVSGLPTGLKYGKVKVEGEGEVMAVYGVPTRAGNYVVTVKTVANGVTVTQRFAVKANALPAYLVGTYYGAATNELGTAEQFTLTVAATGKVSGNFSAQGKRTTFSAASLDRREADGRYVAKIAYTYDRVKYEDELVLATTNAVGGVDLWVASLGAADGVLVGVDARRDVVKEVCGKLTAKTYPVEDETFAEGEFLNARVATSGAVTVSGYLLDANGKKTSVSCSTRLAVLDGERLGCWITIYKTVNKQPPITYVRFWELEY